MHTILVPIYNGIVARTFLRSDVYKELVKDPEIGLVVVTPSSKLEFYKKEFPARNVVFETLDGISENRLGQVLASISFNLLPTKTIWFRQKDRYLKYGNYPNFIIKRAINLCLGHFNFPRQIIRYADRYVPSDSGVNKILEKYKPDLLVAPDVAFGVDRVFLRAAKRRGIFTIGMVRSWDNLTSKGTIQILPDKLILHTERMKRQAIKYAGFPEKDIVVTGHPGYDEFFKPRNISREDFLRSIGVDPKKRLVLFAPFYDRYTGSAIYMINDLIDALDSGKISKDVHFLIRYRPATPNIPEGTIKKSPNVSISMPVQYYFPIQTDLMLARKDWEFSEEDMHLMVNSLYFCDCLINTFSTLTVDGAVLDKPSIGVRFDADPNTPSLNSVKFVVDRHDHFKELEATGGVRLVKNMDELVDAINKYLENPDLDKEGRQRLRDEQIQFFDGKSGHRVAEYLKFILSKDPKKTNYLLPLN